MSSGRQDSDVPTALVTGAGSGMGAAVAQRLAADGYRVVCADIDTAAATATAAGISLARGVHVDVTDPDSVRKLFDDCGPTLRAVVHAAGITTFAPAAELTLEEFDRVVAVNLRGTFIVLQAAAQTLPPGGAIVAFASIESYRHISGHAHYAASKAGVLKLVEAFAEELAPTSIRANAVAPGVVRTAMTARALDHPDIGEEMVSSTPLGRAGDPHEIAAVCAFLCSPAASFVTGACWAVDGGALIKSPL